MDKGKWKSIFRIAAKVGENFVPGAMAIEQGAEDIVDAKTNQQKQEAAVKEAVRVLQSVSKETGKDFMTPEVEAAIRDCNDASVRLMNALARADATQTPGSRL